MGCRQGFHGGWQHHHSHSAPDVLQQDQHHSAEFAAGTHGHRRDPESCSGAGGAGGAALREGRYEKRHCPPEQSQLSYLSMKGISMEGAARRGDLWPPYGFDL